jgi:proteasome lid subunit RPN8/RPN11
MARRVVIGKFLMVVQLTLALARAQLNVIRHHAEQAYPKECCGVLLGVTGGTGGTQVVTSVQALPNAWTETAMAELMPFVAMAKTDGLRPTSG